MSEVTMTATYLPNDPGTTNWGAPGVKFDAWRCVLTYDGRSMAVTYRMGEGLRVCAPKAGKGRDKYAGPGAVDFGPWFGKVPEHAQRYMEPRECHRRWETSCLRCSGTRACGKSAPTSGT